MVSSIKNWFALSWGKKKDYHKKSFQNQLPFFPFIIFIKQIQHRGIEKILSGIKKNETSKSVTFWQDSHQDIKTYLKHSNIFFSISQRRQTLLPLSQGEKHDETQFKRHFKCQWENLQYVTYLHVGHFQLQSICTDKHLSAFLQLLH